LATIDFSKAFDSVWHSALFHILLALGLPPCLVRCIRSFLSDRRAKVPFRGARSRSFRIKRGVPQGSAVGLAHFILYVDNLVKTLLQGTSHSLYADDLAIWYSFLDPLRAAHTVQKTLNHLEECSLKWRLLVNTAKCECCFFNTDPHQASHHAQLTLTGTTLTFNPTQKFLGMTLTDYPPWLTCPLPLYKVLPSF